MKKTIVIIGVVLAFSAFPASTSYAYIDPNTGSLFFQILAPLAAIVTSAWLLAKEKIVAFFVKVLRLITDRDQ